MSGGTFGCDNWGEGTSSVSCLGTRDAPNILHTQDGPTAENDPTQSTSCAQAEKPCSGVRGGNGLVASNNKPHQGLDTRK